MEFSLSLSKYIDTKLQCFLDANIFARQYYYCVMHWCKHRDIHTNTLYSIINLSYCRIQTFTVVWFVLSKHRPSCHLLVLKGHVCDLDFSSSKNSALQDVMIQNLEILRRIWLVIIALLVLCLFYTLLGIPEDPRLSSLGRSDTRHRRRRNFSFQATFWRMGGCSTSSSWQTWWCSRSDDGGYGMIF